MGAAAVASECPSVLLLLLHFCLHCAWLACAVRRLSNQHKLCGSQEGVWFGRCKQDDSGLMLEGTASLQSKQRI